MIRNKIKHREYNRAYEALRYANRRAIAIAELGGQCIKCGATSELHFDHINPLTKSMSSYKMFKTSEEKMRAELSKCQLLCKDCHHQKSMLERGCKPYKHGTYNMYNKHGCRCNTCKEKLAIHAREYRKKKVA